MQSVINPAADLTPIEQHGPLYVKRDDLFEIAGVRGGKARTCWSLAEGAKGLVTAGSRSSPQCNIVAHIARELRIPARLHTPTGELSPELLQAQACGAEIIQHKAGYNNVIIARAREDAAARGWTNIPFGMTCQEAVKQTASQVANLPACKRIVVPVGSGMTLCGIVNGLYRRDDWAFTDAQIVGVSVGANPERRLCTFMPFGWQQWVQILPVDIDYHTPYTLGGQQAEWLRGVPLDPHYEAKAAMILEPSDLFWVVGIRATALATGDEAVL